MPSNRIWAKHMSRVPWTIKVMYNNPNQRPVSVWLIFKKVFSSCTAEFSLGQVLRSWTQTRCERANGSHSDQRMEPGCLLHGCCSWSEAVWPLIDILRLTIKRWIITAIINYHQNAEQVLSVVLMPSGDFELPFHLSASLLGWWDKDTLLRATVYWHI